MASEKIKKIIPKYLINQASFEELDYLELWIRKPGNEQEFLNYIKVNYAIDYNLKQIDINKTKNLISSLIKEEKRRIKRKAILNYTKYAAVFIGVMFAVYFFKENLLSSVNQEPSNSVIVNSNNLLPGTDKATLTLEDGSVVALEKGNAYQTKNASSNGENLTYSSNNTTTNEIAYNYLTIPRGGQFHVVLADGTEVWLNSESQLKYPVAFVKGQSRKVELVYGEAYFDVSPSSLHNGSKFKVSNKSQEIEVIGTEFNIKAYRDDINIYTTLVEGSVSIDVKNQKHLLKPNQQSNLNLEDNSLKLKNVDVYSEISWKDGVFTFEAMTLKDIAKVLSRWYDIDFVFEDKAVEENKFNGSLNRKLKINEILDIIKNFGKIKAYEINEKTIVIK